MLRGLGLTEASGGDIFASMKVWARRQGTRICLAGGKAVLAFAQIFTTFL